MSPSIPHIAAIDPPPRVQFPNRRVIASQCAHLPRIIPRGMPGARSLRARLPWQSRGASRRLPCGGDRPMSTRKGQAASVTLLRREQLRSASTPTYSIVGFPTSIRRKSRARLWSMEGQGTIRKVPLSSLSFSYWNRKATQHSGRLSGRKTEAANMVLSPPRRKRNGAGFF